MNLVIRKDKILNTQVMRHIGPGNATYRSSEPSGGSGDVSPSSPGCPPFPVWSVWSSEEMENTHG